MVINPDPDTANGPKKSNESVLASVKKSFMYHVAHKLEQILHRDMGRELPTDIFSAAFSMKSH